MRFCWADPQVVPLSTTGVKLTAVKGALEGVVESLVEALAGAVAPVLFAAAEVLVLWPKIVGSATKVAIKVEVGLNILTTWIGTGRNEAVGKEANVDKLCEGIK